MIYSDIHVISSFSDQASCVLRIQLYRNNMFKVLCLHGCRQSKSVFQSLLRPYIKLGKPDIEFIFLEATHDAPMKGKSWYSKNLELEDVGRVAAEAYQIEETMDEIENCIIEERINVLLGFSQGANVVDTFLRYRYASESPYDIERAVLMSGYSFKDEDIKSLDVPVLTIASLNDELVPFKHNPSAYKSRLELLHDKGHKVPTRMSTVRSILSFIRTGALG